MNRPQEPIYLITQSDINLLVEYVTSVPTGTVVGGKLVQVLDRLDKLQLLPPSIWDILRSARASRMSVKPEEAPTAAPGPNGAGEEPNVD